MSRQIIPVRCLSVALLATVVTGCGSKVSQSNYDKIQTDMAEDQVVAILGPGKEQSSGGVPGMVMGKSVVWQDGDKTITVSYINGKVATKAESGL